MCFFIGFPFPPIFAEGQSCVDRGKMNLSIAQLVKVRSPQKGGSGRRRVVVAFLIGDNEQDVGPFFQGRPEV